MVGAFGAMPRPVAKRRVFFSFHYQNDIWRVNQVRQSWRYNHESTRETEGFYDASIWERSKLTGPESLKGLIRNGMQNTSVTCVLIGSQTYERRWVRYELARSVIKGNGLMGVRIHLMGDRNGYTSMQGPNPLEYMGVYKTNGAIKLAELSNGRWVQYADYTQAVDLPPTWIKPHDNNVIRLSRYAGVYCYRSQNGRDNFSSWVRQAAIDVGR